MAMIASAALTADYRRCRRLNARHGKTFYLATALLPPSKRPAIHALYGFARYADDIVDQPDSTEPAERRLALVAAEVELALDGRPVSTPVVRALADTVHRFDIAPELIRTFLEAMAADLEVDRYRSFADLSRYMWGSAAVIGLQVLPVLGIAEGACYPDAKLAAADLGIAFQLTNFIRDVGEDYHRGRIYLPLQELAAHGVSESMLAGSQASPQLRSLIAAQVTHARDWYRRAEPGIDMLARDAQDCVRTAFILYRGILDEIERADHDVLRARATVPRRRRVAVGLDGYRAALRARRA